MKSDTSKRRVFVLGAGFSYGAGLPITYQLLPLLYENLSNVERKTLIAAIRYFYPTIERANDLRIIKDVAVEDFMSLLDIGEQFNESVPETFLTSRKIRDLRFTLIKGVASLLLEKQREAESHSGRLGYIDSFLAKLNPLDTIVTFNWDTLVERRLHHINRDFVLCSNRLNEGIAVLKLHGSLDWYLGSEIESKRGLSPVHRQVFVMPWARLWPTKSKASDALPFIVPPTFYKQFRGHADLEEVWAMSFERLLKADEIYFCGYRLPPEDMYARFILARAIRYNVIKRTSASACALSVKVVNPSKDVVDIFQKYVFRNIKFEEAKFEESSLAR